MRQGWCIGLRLPVQLRANNHYAEHLGVFDDFKVILNNGFAKHVTLTSI